MLKTTLALAVLSFSTAAFAADAPDMSKVGPWTRPVVKKDDKGIDALYKAMDEANKKQDLAACAALHDFPVYMVTDNSKGEFYGKEWSKEMWVKEMTPMMTSPMPKDLKHEIKKQVNYLSETLAVVTETHKQTLGKQTSSWISSSIITQKDGKWLFKSGAEAGWGDAPPAESAQTTPPAKK